ncbi:MAG: hypothetical protein ABIR79_00845 [Candidatus Binatia bacterium]
MPVGNHVLAITAVKAETRAVLAALTRPIRTTVHGFPAWEGRAGARIVTLVQSGIGPTRATAAVAALPAAHDLIVSLGLAGALSAELAPGDIVLPETIVWEESRGAERHTIIAPLWRRAHTDLVADPTLRVHTGPLLSSPVVVGSPERKRAAAARTGAIAVEMETAALVTAARERGIPILALRVILDDVDLSLESLPADLDSSWAARARLVGRPAAWPVVARLAREIPPATRALTRAVKIVFPAL